MALSAAERKNYQCVKEAVLRAFEQVPEYYGQRFRNWRKSDRQTYAEVARDLVSFFKRWCSSVNCEMHEDLVHLMILEQFKNIVPDRLATYVNEHKIKTVTEAAVLADEYVLTHKVKSRDHVNTTQTSAREEYRPSCFNGNSCSKSEVKSDFSKRSQSDINRCNYCLEVGHWKSDCEVLKAKNKNKARPAKFGLCAAPIRHLKTKVVDSCASCPAGDTPTAGVSGPETPAVGLCSSEVTDPDEFVGESYGPFITDGFVSLVGSSEKKPVKILRDTGAT